MAISSGFYDSVDGDRKYNAEQMSSIFDGLITDGIFLSIGDHFDIKSISGNEIRIGTGRAWFNKTWIYNDATIVLKEYDAEVLQNRYDTIVIEVDHSESVRAADIKIVKGTPDSVNPAYPTLTNNENVHQHPLFHIYRAAGETEVKQANVTNVIGTSACPYATAILQTVSIDNIVAQFNAYVEDWKSSRETSFDSWSADSKTSFDSWFANLKTQLSGDVAGNLQNEIDNMVISETVSVPITGWTDRMIDGTAYKQYSATLSNAYAYPSTKIMPYPTGTNSAPTSKELTAFNQLVMYGIDDAGGKTLNLIATSVPETPYAILITGKKYN